MNPVCCTCSQEMKCSKTGRVVVINRIEPQNCCCISGDEFQCPDCGHKIVKFGHDNTYWEIQDSLPDGTIDIIRRK